MGMPVLPLLLLNATNHLTVRGPITAASADAFVLQTLTFPRASFVYLDTGGGDVEAGMRMVQLLRQRPYSCIAQRAHSMGFALLQACRDRWVVPAASLMQHAPWLRLEGELPHVQARLAYVMQLEEQLVQLQAARLHVDADAFRQRTQHEWWLTGHTAVAQGAADAEVAVTCAAVTDGTTAFCPLTTHLHYAASHSDVLKEARPELGGQRSHALQNTAGQRMRWRCPFVHAAQCQLSSHQAQQQGSSPQPCS